MPHTGVNKDKDGNRMAKCKTPLTTLCASRLLSKLFNNYDIKSAEDVQDVLKQIFAPFLSPCSKVMENHLGHS